LAFSFWVCSIFFLFAVSLIFVFHSLSEKCAKCLRETLEASFVDDLLYVYDDPELLKDIEKACSRLEYKKFLDARKFPTRIVVTSVSSEPLPVPPVPRTGGSVVPPIPPANPVGGGSGTTTIDSTTLDRELEEKRKKLIEMDRMLFEEKEKHRIAIEKSKTLEKKKKMIAALEAKIIKAASLDVVFVMDCSGSMKDYMENTKNNIIEFVTNITSLHPNVSLRLAFIGYRDHYNKEERLAVLRFTTSVTEFKSFVTNQKAIGNYDDAEDVLGGLHVARGLDWESETKILYHIADAPCHGREFHDSRLTDDYPDGKPVNFFLIAFFLFSFLFICFFLSFFLSSFLCFFRFLLYLCTFV
jgi:hypothetical protein